MSGKEKMASVVELPEIAEAVNKGLKPIEKFHNSLALSRWALKILSGR